MMEVEQKSNLPIEMNFVLRRTEPFRLGQLLLRQRQSISTPTFVAATSRGVIPHVTPDVLSKLTRVPAVYVGLEDCKCQASPVMAMTDKAVAHTG